MSKKRTWIKRSLHTLAYLLGLVMLISTWLSDFLPIYEQIFRTGVILYLSIIYIEFVDGTMLDRIKPSVLFEESTKRAQKNEVDVLIQASRMTLYWVRMVQASESELEKEYNEKRLQEHLQFIEELELPKKYHKDRRDILEEARGFINDMLKQG